MNRKRKPISKQSTLRKKRSHRKTRDAYVALDRIPEEERNPNKFDSHLEYPLEEEFEDEEIDEELAFDKNDELQFSHVFEYANRPNSNSPNSNDEMDEIFGASSDEAEDLIEVSSDQDNSDPDQLKKIIIGDHRSKKNLKIQSESRPEDVLNLVADPGSHLDRMMEGINGKLKSVHKSLDVLKKQQPLSVPLPRTIRERQVRKAGYLKTLEHIAKWDDIVYANRRAPTLDFAAPCANLKRPGTLEELVEDFQPQSKMEKDIAAMLDNAGINSSESIVQLEDDSALKTMTLEELKEKRGKLAKMRSLLFNHEVKSRRIKKIKSKEYHRRLQRSIRKKALRYSTLNTEEAQRKLLEEMAFNRAKERLTQKHSTMNKFARRIMRRGWPAADEQTKQALEEQLRQNQELKQKLQSKSSDEEQEEDNESLSSEEDTESSSKTKTVLSKILSEEIDEDSLPKTGLLRLPFMQKAMRKQEEANKSKAGKILETLDPDQVTTESTPPVLNVRRKFTGSKPTETQNNDSEIKEPDPENSTCVSSSVPNRASLFDKGPSLEPEVIPTASVEETAHPAESIAEPDPAEMCQEELISLAFADDDIADFDKEQEMNKELPKVEEISLLPGWGRWKDDQHEPKWMQEKRTQNQKLRDDAKTKRRDFNKKGIFISEKSNTSLEKYHIATIPKTFDSANEYERSLQHTIGPDCNTINAFEDFTRPKVVKRQGVIIEPLRLNQSSRDIREDVKELKEGVVKMRTLIGGEVQKQVLLNNTAQLKS
eukprot:g1616.t1